MKNYFLSFVVAMSLVAIGSKLTAQTNLKEYARQKSLQWQSQRALAESLAVQKHMPIRVDREGGESFELQRIENGIPIYYATDNLNSAKTISSNKVWPTGGYGFSLTGNGITFGEWDAGKPRTTHQEYSGRILSTQGSLHYHSAHVAGTMIAAGIDPNAKGMSSNATLKSFDWNNDNSEMAAQAAAGLKVSNHSYGQITGWYYNYFGDGRWTWFGDTLISETEAYQFGFYDADAQAWDNIAHNAPYYLIVKAAGNDRNEGPYPGTIHWVVVNGSWVLSTKTRSADGRGGYDCISSSALSKNILTVGAVNKITTGYTKPSDVVMSSFSCWGPTDDGRIKPDIVTDGVNLYSTLETADNAYGTMSGTSMASPSAAGAVGLLLEEQNNLHSGTPIRSSTLKAIIINTANEAGLNPGPDYSYGWGLMNTYKSVLLMKQDSLDGFGSHIREMLLNQGDTIRFDIACNSNDSLKATICWTDPSGTPLSPALNPPDRMLVNDLDLRIIKKNNQQVYYPWILNPSTPTVAATTGDNIIDNIEQVSVKPTERTVYTVQITHKGTLSGGSQYVSIAISGNIPGPDAILTAQKYDVDVDSGFTKIDSFKVYNVGSATLAFSINEGGDGLPSWISLDKDTGSVEPLDSLTIHVTFGDITQAVGEYSSSIIFVSNDSIRGTLMIPVSLHSGTRRIISTSVSDKWNMISLPCKPLSYLKSSLFPTAQSSAFAYDGMYTDHETLSIGTGYWLRFNGDQTIPIDGYVFKLDTLDLRSGWNLIGMISDKIPVNAVTTIPTGIMSSFFFNYNGSYYISDSLFPGKSYWIQLNQSGKLVLSGNYPPLPKFSFDNYFSEFSKITITDGNNHSQSLYVSTNIAKEKMNSFGLPPKPPVGAFDVRFGSGKMLETISNVDNEKYELPINIQTISNRITLDWNFKPDGIRVYSFVDELGNIYPLNQSGSITINSKNSEDRKLTLHIESQQLPKDFALQQNYPNPFNPSTLIKYSMPSTGYVSIKIYNLLGHEVATLVDGVQEAGYHTVEFNADDCASGIYFYKMKTEKFTSFKKMMLMR